MRTADIEAANVALRTLGEWKGKKVFLMGNHEEAVLFGAIGFNPKAKAAIDWTREQFHLETEDEEARNLRAEANRIQMELAANPKDLQSAVARQVADALAKGATLLAGGKRIARPGNDVTIVAWSYTVSSALLAAMPGR